jgi:hypothetical protein
MPIESTRIDDLVILGRGAPDQMRDGRITICTAGWSERLGFVRVYPTRTTSPLRQWNVVSVPVEKSTTDSRQESWKIQGSKSEWDRLDGRIEVTGRLEGESRRTLVRRLASGCVNLTNEAHGSLAVVRPVSLAGYLSERSDVDLAVQRTLFGGELEKTKRAYPFQPRLRYRCSDCRAQGEHDQQLIEWGCYEWFRKRPGEESKVFDNLHLGDSDWEHHLLVGNQANHRQSFLSIGVLRWKK